MASRTITALYDSKTDAERAKSLLSQSGISSVDIHAEGASGDSGKSGGFLSGLKDMFGGHEDTQTYQEGLRRGHFLLTAQVADNQADTAIRLLDGTNAIDLDRKQSEWGKLDRTAGSQPTGAAASPSTAALGSDREQVIPIVQEQLKVGKREVERGGLRVRSYIVETPVSEQVTLREEHVDIERRPVNRPVTNADDLLQNRTVEMTETAEEAVVAKDAVVVEEVAIRKDVGQRTQEINDTVRRTEVEVERADAKTAKTPGLGGSPPSTPRI